MNIASKVARASVLVLMSLGGFTACMAEIDTDEQAAYDEATYEDTGQVESAMQTACIDQVPTLTGNSSRVSTSGTYSSSYPAWKAFDGSNSMWISETWETPAWIAYDFGTAKTIQRYTIKNTNGSLTSRAPKDFTFEGWTGSSWNVLDTRVNQTGWVSGTPRSYLVSNPGSYTKYRLRITDDNDSRSGVVVISIGDLSFETCACPDQVPTLTGNSWRVSTSGTYSSSYPAWKAFDGSNSMWISKTWETPAWIAYDFGTAETIDSYTIKNTNGSLTSRAPKDFTFEGWTGSSWSVLDTRVNQTGWVSGTPRTYAVANPGSYTKYRLRVTDDNDPRSGVVVISIGDLRFETCATCQPKTCNSWQCGNVSDGCGGTIYCGSCGTCGNGRCEPNEPLTCPLDCSNVCLNPPCPILY